MNSKYRQFVLLQRIFQPWQWKRRKKRNRFEQTSRTLQRKISMRSTKDQLVEKDVLMPILLWSPWKYRCGQRTVRLAVVACSQSQAVFARRRIKGIFSPGSGNEGKRNHLNRRPELLQRKISMRSTKDQLVEKEHVLKCQVKHMLPVEPSDCRRGAFTRWRNCLV
ncbi:hypothetical protein TNCV_1271311 [Trichonephila clavipes]|nr:hypothetical protein TNCV_1271311 [Trichonephila clavipes]